MSDLHYFWLGFWTMFAILIAGFYVIIYCFDTLSRVIYKTCDDINDYIDTHYAATAQKLPLGPLDPQYMVDV